MAYVSLSTTQVAAPQAFAYWREMICDTFVQLTAEPVAGASARFSGRIGHVGLGSVEMSTVVAGGQHVRRTPALIARSNEEFLLASIQVRGAGRVEQDGQVAELTSGAMAFYDSTRPYTLHFDGDFEQLVVQLPKDKLVGLPADTRKFTAQRLDRSGPGGAVGGFFRSLARAQRDNPAATSVLQPQAIGMFTAAAACAAGSQPTDLSLERVRVEEFLRRHLADSALDAQRIADACHMSRRTLYRLLGAEGVAAHLRRLRIEHAQTLLLADPRRPVGAVAAACGFDSEAGFYRAFRVATGLTPGDYRQAGTSG
jgi:AraC-like DNA-binding protein